MDEQQEARFEQLMVMDRSELMHTLLHDAIGVLGLLQGGLFMLTDANGSGGDQEVMVMLTDLVDRKLEACQQFSAWLAAREAEEKGG